MDKNRPPPPSAADKMPPTPSPWPWLRVPRGPLNQLHLASHDGSTKRVLALLSRGSFENNEGDRQGWNPPMHRACHGSCHVLETLVDNRADVRVQADEAFTCLHISCHQGNLSATKLLLRAGAHLYATTSKGFSALHVASGYGYVAVMRVLIEPGSNVNARLPRSGETPSFTAAQGGHGAPSASFSVPKRARCWLQ